MTLDFPELGYRITSDEHCWMVQRINRKNEPGTPRFDKRGAVEWVSVEYHRSLKRAGQGLQELLWRLEEPTQGETAGQAIERLHEAVAATLRAQELLEEIKA